MRRLVIMDEMYWEALTLMAQDYGFKSRNEMITHVLMEVVDREPEYKVRGQEEAKVRDVARTMAEPWKPDLRELSRDEIMDVLELSEEELKSLEGGGIQTPELPEL